MIPWTTVGVYICPGHVAVRYRPPRTRHRQAAAYWWPWSTLWGRAEDGPGEAHVSEALPERLGREAVVWERACHVHFPAAVMRDETAETIRLYFTDLNIPPKFEQMYAQAFRAAFAAVARAALDEAKEAALLFDGCGEGCGDSIATAIEMLKGPRAAAAEGALE